MPPARYTGRVHAWVLSTTESVRPVAKVTHASRDVAPFDTGERYMLTVAREYPLQMI